MIKIVENREDRVLFEKENRDEKWFNNDCSDENLKKQCNREGDKISRVQFMDDKYIGSKLMIYFECVSKNEGRRKICPDCHSPSAHLFYQRLGGFCEECGTEWED